MVARGRMAISWYCSSFALRVWLAFSDRARQWLWNLQQSSHIQKCSSFSANRQPTHRPTSYQWTALWASSSHRSKACPRKWTGSASGMRAKIGYHFGILLRDHPPSHVLQWIGVVARQRLRDRRLGDTSSQHLRRNGLGLSLNELFDS